MSDSTGGVQLYPIQKHFIKQARRHISANEHSIFSSPTGTGKTLSLLLSVAPYISGPADMHSIFGSSTSMSGISEHNMQLISTLTAQTRVYYCSRTHTQLSQAVNELKRLGIGCTAVVLGSRMVYCRNEDVRKIGVIEMMNEKCRELREKDRCTYYLNNRNSGGAAMGIYDIEDMISSDCSACPYYKSKELARTASIVFMPYQVLFSKETRESFKLDIKDNIVIIDEAHNIVESVIGMNSVTVGYAVVEKYVRALLKYRNRIRGRTSDKLGIIGIVDMLIDVLGKLSEFGTANKKTTDEQCMNVNTFLIKSGLDGYNMLVLKEHTRLVQVLEGYEKNLHFRLFAIINFLSLLTNSDSNGIVLYNSTTIRFTPLDARMYFEDILECRSLILAGGTMEPLDTLLSVIGNVSVHSYGSVCNRFVAYMLGKGPAGRRLRLTYGERMCDDTMDDLMNALVNLMNNVRGALKRENGKYGTADNHPISTDDGLMKRENGKYGTADNHLTSTDDGLMKRGNGNDRCGTAGGHLISTSSASDAQTNSNRYGTADGHLTNSTRSAQTNSNKGGIVCFLPSKSFLDIIKKRITKYNTRDIPCIFEDINLFTKTCAEHTAVLFAVMGGRLSEGINFSDHFCRLLIVVGIPYPSITTEIRERIRHNGREYITTSALKTVNQTLGRALRHKDDYAGIVLIDERYETVKHLLVPWIRDRVRSVCFGELFSGIHTFLRSIN